jgi:hypothetical protein
MYLKNCQYINKLIKWNLIKKEIKNLNTTNLVKHLFNYTKK